MEAESKLSTGNQTKSSFVRSARQFVGRPLYSNGLLLMLTYGAVSLLGALFWVIVARTYPASQVGLATAVVSSAGLLSTFSKLGLDFSLMRYLHKEGDKKGLVNTCFTTVALASLVVTIVFISGLQLWSPSLSFVQRNIPVLVVFLVSTSVNSLIAIQNAAFVGLRSAKYTLLQNILMGMVKLPLPLIFVFLGITGIVLSWGVAIILGTTAAWLLFLPRLISGYSPQLVIRPKAVRAMFGFSAGNYVADIMDSLPGLVLPLMIISMLPSEMNAYFFVAWMISSVLTQIPVAVGSSLLAEGSYEPGQRRANVTRALKFTFGILLPTVLVVVLLGKPMLRLFGQSYDSHAIDLLRLLALSCLPLAVVRIYVTYQRIRSKVLPVVIVYTIGAVTALTLSSVLLPTMGLNGIGIAWVTTQGSIALVCGSVLILERRRGIAAS